MRLPSWVRGNTVALTVYLYEPQVDEHGIPERDHQGKIIFIPVDVDAYDEWRVRLKAEEYINIEAEAGETEGTIVLTIPGCMPCGVYAVEFTGMLNGNAVRSFEYTMFAIVENNGSANVTFDKIDGEKSCDVDIKIQLVPFSVTRGKNAYELWKELPGNEDKTMQDYIDEVLDLNGITDACITATEAATAAAVIGSHPDYIGEDYYVYHWTNGQYVKTDIYVKGEPGGDGSVVSITRKLSTGVNIADITIDRVTTQLFAPEGGGTQVQADWTQTNTTAPDYIKNKPNMNNYATNAALVAGLETKQNLLTYDTNGTKIGDLDVHYGINVGYGITVGSSSDKVIITPGSVTIGGQSVAPQEQADWNETDSSDPAYIKNKPTNLVYQGPDTGTVPSVSFDPEADTVHVTAQTLSSAQQLQARTNIGAGTSNFSGSYNDLTNKPTIPAAQVNSDWNASSGVAQILNKPTIPDAVSGTNDGTNWTSITIGSTTKAIPSGGGGEANVIESISINGTSQTVTNKNVDLPVPTSTAVYQIVSISQSAYDALVSGGTVSSTTLYLITS